MSKANSLKIPAKILIIITALTLIFTFSSCSSKNKKPSVDELKVYRELSWEGTELTVKLGENKSSGCN